MRELVGFDIYRVVILTGEPCKALVVDVNPPRVHARYQNVYPDIELKPVDQKRVGDIPGDNAWLIDGHLRNLIDDKYTFALRGVGWLDDPLVVVHLGSCLVKARAFGLRFLLLS